ncbi:hypothetical protein ACRCPS_17615 [Pseudomonas aeruginosa]
MDKFLKWVTRAWAELSKGSVHTELSLCTSDGTAPFASAMGELIGRHKKLGNYITSAWIAFAVVGVISCICLGIASVVGPDQDISSIDVPKHIQALFEPEQTASPPHRTGVGGLSDAFEDISGGFTTLAKVLGGLMAFFGVVSAVLRQSLASGIMGLTGGLMMMTMPGVLSTLVEPTGGSSRYEERADTPRGSLADEDFASLSTLLSSNSGVDGAAKDYILAQAAIASGRDSPELINSAAQRLRSPGENQADWNFKVPGQVAYAIEVAADGMVGSKEGKAYLSKAEKTAAPWQAVGSFFNRLGFVLSLIVLATIALRQYIKARLTRLDDLLAQLA